MFTQLLFIKNNDIFILLYLYYPLQCNPHRINMLMQMCPSSLKNILVAQFVVQPSAWLAIFVLCPQGQLRNFTFHDCF